MPITINPANLIGKLHDAGRRAVEKKYTDVEIRNSAVSNENVASIKDGDYEIIVNFDSKKYSDVERLLKPITEYITYFAGSDIANEFVKDKEIKRILRTSVKNEETAVIPYSIKAKSGKRMSNREIEDFKDEDIEDGEVDKKDSSKEKEKNKKNDKEDSNKQKGDSESNEEITSALTQASDVSLSDPVANAAKSKDYLSNEGNAKKFIEAVSDMSKNSSEMNETKMLLIMTALKHFKDTYNEADEDIKEESTINEESVASTALAIYNKYSKYLNASTDGFRNTAKSMKFKLKDLVKRMSDVKTGETKSFWKRLADFSPNVLRQFSKEVYRWSENAILKAKDNFKANFVLKTVKDKAKEQKDSEIEVIRKMSLNAAKAEIRKLKDVIVGPGDWDKYERGEKGSVEFQKKDIKNVDKELAKFNKTQTKVNKAVPTYTLSELLDKAGPETLKQFLALVKNGEIYNKNGDVYNIFDSRKENAIAATLRHDYAPELYGWIPEKVRKSIQDIKPQDLKGKIEESVFLDFSKAFNNKSMIVEANCQYQAVKSKFLKEYGEKMNKLSNKLIRQITNGKNISAQNTLEKILKEKMEQKLKEVLEKNNNN